MDVRFLKQKSKVKKKSAEDGIPGNSGSHLEAQHTQEFWLVAVKFVQTAEVHRSASTSLSSRADFFLNLANRKLAQGKVRKAKARNVFIPAHAFHRHKKFFGLRPFKI
uniref:Uncharacterized protein n=1 Tax=Caenorhabditis japonica TaxID=281687 RepID=A0A8R1ICK6_CAEJA